MHCPWLLPGTRCSGSIIAQRPGSGIRLTWRTLSGRSDSSGIMLPSTGSTPTVSAQWEDRPAATWPVFWACSTATGPRWIPAP